MDAMMDEVERFSVGDQVTIWARSGYGGQQPVELATVVSLTEPRKNTQGRIISQSRIVLSNGAEFLVNGADVLSGYASRRVRTRRPEDAALVFRRRFAENVATTKWDEMKIEKLLAISEIMGWK